MNTSDRRVPGNLFDGMFSGRTVLITGALGSLGRAQVLAFARAGASVMLLDRPEHPDAASFVAEVGGGSIYIGQDLADLAATEATVAALDVHVLVHDAAIIVNRPFQDFSAGEFEEQMRVNVGALFALTRAVTPGMKARGEGRIISFASVTLTGQWDGYVPYVASKGAIVGLTKSLARELGPHGIRVNAIAPGAVVSDAETRVFGDKAVEYDAWVLRNQCLKSRIQPEAIADLVLFLASPLADMITGQVVHCDGGW